MAAAQPEGGPGEPGMMSWRRVLVLGGIRSGKSEFAEALVADADRVRYVATARRGDGDADWDARIDAHVARRPANWRTTEIGHAPASLSDVLDAARESEALLLDDLGGWVGAVGDVTGRLVADSPHWPGLMRTTTAAMTRCRARLVLVSPEVGLSVIPATAAGRDFADALGLLNRAVAAVCDVVVLVIAGNAVPVKGRL